MIGANEAIFSRGMATSRRGPDIERLDVFLGVWRTTGHQYASEFGPAARVDALETYEWLTGGRFLVHNLKGRLGEAEMACIEVVEYDPSGECYRTHTFYNDGRSAEW